MLTSGDIISRFQLQQLLSAETQASMHPVITPHHPLSCFGFIAHFQDGSMCCQHSLTEPSDGRTQAAVDHSIAMLLIEIARETL